VSRRNRGGYPPLRCSSCLLLARMKPEEIRDGLWMTGVFERWGSMTTAEADEWRRRILARQGSSARPGDPFHAPRVAEPAAADTHIDSAESFPVSSRCHLIRRLPINALLELIRHGPATHSEIAALNSVADYTGSVPSASWIRQFRIATDLP
jgi:hypothetical protein